MRVNDEQKVRMWVSDKSENEYESEKVAKIRKCRINIKMIKEKMIYIDMWNTIQMMTSHIFAKERAVFWVDNI